MNIIDFHTHVFPDSLAPRAMRELVRQAPQMLNVLDGTRASLRKSMKNSGVSVSVTLPVATKPSQVQPILADAIAHDCSDLIAFGAIHPLATDFTSHIEFMKNHGIRGIKLHPEYQDFNIDDPCMFPIYDALAETGLIVVFHAGEDPGPFDNTHSRPERIARIAGKFPGLCCVAAHMGGYRMWEDVERYLCGTPVFFDTSAVLDSMTHDMFMRIARLHGTGKILFGSDSPWFYQKTCIEWIDSLPLNDREKELVFSENAGALLRIHP
jgi:predicted TIM-barrel fold metal-dependent hydrolase